MTKFEKKSKLKKKVNLHKTFMFQLAFRLNIFYFKVITANYARTVQIHGNKITRRKGLITGSSNIDSVIALQNNIS